MDAHRDIVHNPEQTDAMQCSWCERYYNAKTKKYIPKPGPGLLGGHGICIKCYEEMQIEIDRMKR